MSTVAALQVPLIPLSEVIGSAGTLPPAQIVNVVPNPNVGTVFGVTATLKPEVVAHCPASGVKVYVRDDWLSMIAGLQVPVIPFVDVVGNEGTVAPAQIESEVPKLNAGVTIGFTVTLNVVVVAHCPASGVNV